VPETELLLQSVMAFAVTDERIAENPVRSVRKPARTVERDVPPVPPVLVERMRLIMLARSPTNGLRDALIVTLIAYEGLRPEELLALTVDDLGEKLRIRGKNVDGELLTYTKNRRKRSVPLTAAIVRQDIAEYQLATGIRRGLLFPRADGDPWRSTTTATGASASTSRSPRRSDCRRHGPRPTRRSSTTSTPPTGSTQRTRSASHASLDRAASHGCSTFPRAPDRDVLYVSYTPRLDG
jgi:integrase